MAISKESKYAIRDRINQLDSLKAPVIKELQDLADKRAVLIARRDEIEAAITKLKVDLNG